MAQGVQAEALQDVEAKRELVTISIAYDGWRIMSSGRKGGARSEKNEALPVRVTSSASGHTQMPHGGTRHLLPTKPHVTGEGRRPSAELNSLFVFGFRARQFDLWTIRARRSN
jgi:hypothetical protein